MIWQTDSPREAMLVKNYRNRCPRSPLASEGSALLFQGYWQTKYKDNTNQV